MEEFTAPDISLKIQLLNMPDHPFDLERISLFFFFFFLEINWYRM